MAGKFMKMEDLAAHIRLLKSKGKRVVMCNGVFDLLHVGHVRYFEDAKKHGDILIVVINDDVSARKLKGTSRPYMPEAERAELLGALACVDFVTIHSGENMVGALTVLRPDVHAKGTDYTHENLPERELDAKLGIEIAIVGGPKDHSSTGLAERVAGKKG